MAEDLNIDYSLSKKERYEQLYPQIKALVEGEKNEIANQANFCAALMEAFQFLWVGFYHVDSEEELILGPFQGPVACTRIAKGKGVCGTSWSEAEAIIVEDVDQFPGHISCNSQSKSEIVIPIFDKNEKVKSVLDIDDDQYGRFDEEDLNELEKLLALL